MQNLEEIYKKSQQEETPDLWARIEEKLPEKKKKHKFLVRTPYMGMAAAALFLCLLIPVTQRMAGTKKNADSTAMVFDETGNGVEENGYEMAVSDKQEESESVACESAEDKLSGGAGRLCGDMTVMETVQCDGYQVLVLCTADATEYRAYLAETVDAVPEIGKNYEFVLQEQQGEEWNYAVVEIK